MRILVTGGAGYIGSITTRVLCDAGHEVVVLDTLERGHRGAVDQRATLVVASVGDGDVLDSILPGIDAVLHFAGYIDVAEAHADPDLYYRKNLAEPSMMLDRMTSNGVHSLVFSSTAAVYGEIDLLPITEDAQVCPSNAYGASKLALERMIKITEATGLISAVRFRYFNAAGAWPDGSLGEAHEPENHIIPRVLAAAARSEESAFRLNGTDYSTSDGTCVRDYVHVVDLADAHVRAVTYLEDGGDGVVCNLGSGQGYSNREIVELCSEVTDREIRVVEGPRRPGDVPTLIASNARAREVLGWRPERDLRMMVEDAWRWHQLHPDGFDDGSAKG
ncbi:MAG: UDP-glucose 4-epimerase GalE [Coriobacteriia bacterium]|nr:UDP-glucose 4-epimerase GalE [Coriobacteriia bacterium]